MNFGALTPLKRKDHVMKQKHCFNCFGHVDQCNSKNLCRSKGCGKRHNTLLHDSFMNKNNSNVKPVQFVGTGQVAFLAVQLVNGNHSMKTYAYLDNGSYQSLLLKSTAIELGPNLEKTGKMSISGYHTTKEIDCSKVCFEIKPMNSSIEPVRLNDVMAVPDFNMSAVNVAQLNAFCKNYDHLSHINFTQLERNNVSIIIGNDNLDLIHYKQIIKGPKIAPWGVETPLGWTCAGKTNLVFNESTTAQYTQVQNCPNKDESLLKLVQDWMKVGNLGIASPRKALSENDKGVIENLVSTTKIVDGHYQIGLLCKKGAFLPNNRWLALKQLDQLDQKLSKNPLLKEKYQSTMDADLEKGYVVKVHDANSPTDNVSFLPHHPVTNEHKPGKIRRVANASSIFQGQSLNSNLLKGPDLLSNLTGVIDVSRESNSAVRRHRTNVHASENWP